MKKIKLLKLSAVALLLTTCLSACVTEVAPGPGRVWVPGHYSRTGAWLPGHYMPRAVGGGARPGSVWVRGHYNRFGGWVPGHWS